MFSCNMRKFDTPIIYPKIIQKRKSNYIFYPRNLITNINIICFEKQFFNFTFGKTFIWLAGGNLIAYLHQAKELSLTKPPPVHHILLNIHITIQTHRSSNDNPSTYNLAPFNYYKKHLWSRGCMKG